MHRRTAHRQRGFALLFVVMIVALVAVAAAALLDLVEVDLLIAAEHRRAAVAEAVAEGAVKEIQADRGKGDLLPTANSPAFVTEYTGIDGAGDFVLDPNGIAGGPTPLDETNSAYVRNNAVGTALQRQGYTAELRMLRKGPALNTGFNTAQVMVYEVRSVSAVNNGQATDEVFAQIYAYINAQTGVSGGELHAR